MNEDSIALLSYYSILDLLHSRSLNDLEDQNIHYKNAREINI